MPEPTYVTITIPAEREQQATLVIRRGELGRLVHFHWDTDDDVVYAIHQGEGLLRETEAKPPVMPPPAPMPPKPLETPASASKAKTKSSKSKAKPEPAKPTPPPEPTYLLKLWKHLQRTIPQSRLSFPEGTEEAALKVAARLIDIEQWKGDKPIRINDPAKALALMEKYTDKELKAFYEFSDFASYQPEQELETVTE